MSRLPPFLAAALGLSLGVLPAAMPARAEIGSGRPAGCILIVRGQEAIRGECTFTPLDGTGSFQIAGYNGKFFAYVMIVQPGLADGYWNETPYAGHAHTPLGRLHREGACWVNDAASVCAY